MGRVGRIAPEEWAAIFSDLPRPGDVPTLDAFWNRWIVLRRAAGKRGADSTDPSRYRTHLQGAFGAMTLDAITPAMLVAWAARSAGGRSPLTVRRAYSLLRSMMRTATVMGLIDRSPCILTDLEFPTSRVKSLNPRRAPLSAPELLGLITCSAIPVPRRVLWSILGLGGPRIGEGGGLVWRSWDPARRPLGELRIIDQIDWRTHNRVPWTKTGVPRLVPVHRALALVLTAWRRCYQEHTGLPPDDDQPIVLTKIGTVWNDNAASKALRRDCRKAGLPPRTAHGMRHTFATLARNGGAPKELIRQITHTRPKDIVELYSDVGWHLICGVVAGIRLPLRTSALNF